jgi:hypothetical protein
MRTAVTLSSRVAYSTKRIFIQIYAFTGDGESKSGPKSDGEQPPGTEPQSAEKSSEPEK